MISQKIRALAPEQDPLRMGISRRVALSSSTRPVRQKCSKRRSTRPFKPRPSKYKSGVLKLFSEHAVSPMDGGYMK